MSDKEKLQSENRTDTMVSYDDMPSLGDSEARPGLISSALPPVFSAKSHFDELREKKASDKQRILEEEIIDLEAGGEEERVSELVEVCGENDV